MMVSVGGLGERLELGDVCAIDACFDDSSCVGLEIIINEKFAQFAFEEFRELCRARVIGVDTDFGLCFGTEEPCRDDGSLDLEGAHRVPEEWAAGGDERIGLEGFGSAPGEVFAHEPLGHETGAPCSDVLIRYEREECVGGGDDLVEEDVGVVDASPGGEGPV